MDAYLEQKVAELTRAESQCAFLKVECSKAQTALDGAHGQESDFVYAVDLANLLLAAREERAQLENAVNEARKEPEEPEYEEVDYEEEEGYGYTPLPTPGELASVVYGRYFAYAYCVVFGVVGFVVLCSAIGW